MTLHDAPPFAERDAGLNGPHHGAGASPRQEALAIAQPKNDGELTALPRPLPRITTCSGRKRHPLTTKWLAKGFPSTAGAVFTIYADSGHRYGEETRQSNH